MSEVEPPSSRVLVPQGDAGFSYADESDTGADFARLAGWLQTNWITVTGVLLVGVQAVWFSALMAHSYFRLDDFFLVEHAVSSGLTWNYLMWVNAGHLTPVGNALAWVLTRLSPYDWTLVSWVTLLLLAGAGLALLRMLRTLFGDRPGILLLLAIYLLSPLSFPGLSWWTVSAEILPFEIAIFGAVTSHFHYMKTARRRHLVVTEAWLLLAMASSDKGLAVPLLLFAITSAFLSTGMWLKAAWGALRHYWVVWSLYLVTMVAYVALYVVQLKTSSQAPRLSGVIHGAFDFARTLVGRTFVPGILGGPWRWFSNGSYGIANPPVGLAWVALAVAIGVVLASILVRLRAWRAWAVLLGWIIVVDIVPVLLGRGDILPGGFLGHETRYVVEIPGLTALLAGLAFLPVAHPAPARRRVLAAGRPVTVAIVSLLTAVLIGSIWSFHAYMTGTTSQPGRSYFATVRLAMAQAPAGTVILNAPVPADVLGGLFLGPPGETAQALGPLSGSTGPRFVVRPDGTYDNLMEFDGWGRLVPAAILGAQSPPLSAPQSCWKGSPDGVNIPLQSLPSQVNELRIGYLASASGTIEVTYAGQTQTYNVSQGLHSAFLPVTGSGSDVFISGMDPRQLCVGDVRVGVLLPSAVGIPIPAMAAAG